LSLPWWVLVFFTIESALLRSKNPEWFNLYSSSKIIFISLSAFVCLVVFLARKRIPIPDRCQLIWEKLGSHYLLIFFITASLFSIFPVREGVVVGEDIGGQVKSSLQWIEGKVSSPNFLLSPAPTDLSQNKINWSLRPPGASLLPIPGMLIGLSLGHSIQLALFTCSIAGGLGWLYLFRKSGITQQVLLIVSFLFGLMAGNYISHFSTTNIILFALVPWFLLWLLKLSNSISIDGFSGKYYLRAGFFLLCLGSFCWVKLSGIIAAGTIGAVLLFILLFKVRKRLQATLAFGLLGIFFWLPFAGLERVNFIFSGKTADQAYKQVVSSVEAPLTGEHWMESTQGGWLFWSLVAAPGYALPTKNIAMGVRDLGKQFQGFRDWMFERKINDHVLLAGIFSIFLSLLLIFEGICAFRMLDLKFRIITLCFSVLPFVGLAILSHRFQWNYLMYHAHTFEFWLVFTIPTLVILSKAKYAGIRTFCLSGIILAFPIYKNAQSLAYQFPPVNKSQISETESTRGLSLSRFSGAIKLIEEDSVCAQDILFFLPAGHSGDLVLRTKMRTISTHFSGDNFPKTNQFKSTCELNLYCAYDSSLSENQSFLEALHSKFPQAESHEIFYSQEVIVCKIKLVPTNNG
jgi:hypothetical protein